MGDKLPNYYVEQQRLKAEILDQKSMISKQYLQILEMADRKQRLLDNIEAAKVAITDKDSRLASLESEHGKLEDQEFMKVIRGI